MAEFQGIIVIHKEKGFTSHDVVAKLRGILHMKKIGHTGTLVIDKGLYKCDFLLSSISLHNV